MVRKGRDIHGEAEHAREGGQFLSALKLSDDALLKYQEEGDIFGMVDILASRSITFCLLADEKDEKNFLILAKYENMAGVEIARGSKDRSNIIMPLFRLGQVEEEIGEFSEATNCYKEAIEVFQTYPPKEHNRPAVLNDMKIRYFVCEYKTGNKEALEEAENALISLLEDNEEPKYNKDVWTSGAYMKIAEAVKNDNLEKAKENLEKAREIIDANPDLVLRKKQFEKLASTIN